MFNFDDFKNKEIFHFINNYKNKIKNFDNYFFKIRDKKRFLVAKKCNRTVITEFGKVTYNRRIYYDKVKKDYICFTDKYFNINKRAKITNDFKNEIIKNIGKGKRYQDIKDEYKYSDISIMSISNIIKNAKLKLINLPKIKLLENQKLYINMDDCFINLINENFDKVTYRIRIISFNTGLNKSKYQIKDTLINKRICFWFDKLSNKIKNEKFVNFVKNKINDYYELINNEIIIGGDGAWWIKNVAKKLNAKYVLDKFHAIKDLWRTFIFDSSFGKFDKYIHAKKLFYNGEASELLIFLKQNTKKVDVLSYFNNNAEGIYYQNEDWNIGVSAESDVFHLVKSIKGNGAKIYNYKTFNNMLIARANLINSKL